MFPGDGAVGALRRAVVPNRDVADVPNLRDVAANRATRGRGLVAGRAEQARRLPFALTRAEADAVGPAPEQRAVVAVALNMFKFRIW